MLEGQEAFSNEVYDALNEDLEGGKEYLEFYKEVNDPDFNVAISTPLDTKVRQAKSLLMKIERNLVHKLGDKQFIKIEFSKTYPKDVIEAVAKIYEDQGWYVSPRIYLKPYMDSGTAQRVYGNIILNVNPIPVGKEGGGSTEDAAVDDWDTRMPAEKHEDETLESNG